MKFVCFEDQNGFHWGQRDSSGLLALGQFDPLRAESVNQVIAQLHQSGRHSGSAQPATSQARLLAPVPAPAKIICIGRNYADHASEMGADVAELPVVFNKFPSAVTGPDHPVRLPAISNAVDYEAELVVVMGAAGNHILPEQAMDHVFGYCCGNDVSARDWQKGRPGGQWLLGKSFDTFAPLGPWIVTRDEADVDNLDIEFRLNGKVRQSSNTRQLVFSVGFLISHISRFCTLQPGDLIFTGTPAGVGAGRKPPAFLKDGDVMEVEIGGIGCLKNPVTAE